VLLLELSIFVDVILGKNAEILSHATKDTRPERNEEKEPICSTDYTFMSCLEYAGRDRSMRLDNKTF